MEPGEPQAKATNFNSVATTLRRLLDEVTFRAHIAYGVDILQPGEFPNGVSPRPLPREVHVDANDLLSDIETHVYPIIFRLPYAST